MLTNPILISPTVFPQIKTFNGGHMILSMLMSNMIQQPLYNPLNP